MICSFAVISFHNTDIVRIKKFDMVLVKYGSEEIIKVITVHPEAYICENFMTTLPVVLHKTTNVNLRNDARRQVSKGTNCLGSIYVCKRLHGNPSSHCDMSDWTKVVDNCETDIAIPRATSFLAQ